MRVKTVAILSPGDMGHSVGGALVEHGLDVITCLAGRSERTRDWLAQQASVMFQVTKSSLGRRTCFCPFSCPHELLRPRRPLPKPFAPQGVILSTPIAMQSRP